MRVAIFSDIHANTSALYEVLQVCKKLSVDVYWCLGDLVGRGEEPIDTLEVLKKLFDESETNVCLAGNHDWAVMGRLSLSGMNPSVLQTLRQHVKLLEINRRYDLLEWLSALPVGLRLAELPTYAHLSGYYLAHGYLNLEDAHQAVMMYTRMPVTVHRQFDAYPDARFIAVGHWHRGKLWRQISGERLPYSPEIQFSVPYEFDLCEAPVFVCVGSVGVFNHENPCPSFVLVDIKTPNCITVEFQHLQYFTA